MTTMIYTNSEIHCYEGERPKLSKYGSREHFRIELEYWQNSKKVYQFAPGEEQRLCDFLKVFIDEFQNRYVTGLVEIKSPNKIGDKNFLDEYYAYFLSPDKAENSQETFTKDDLKMAHYIGASFGYNKKCCTVKERGSDFEDWFTNNFKRK